MSYIDDLRDVIRKLHGVDSEHVESVPVKETFRNKVVWEGIVEVFRLKGHPSAKTVYAWAHQTDNPDKPLRHVIVLRSAVVESPLDAVRAAIVQEYRNLATEES